MLAKSEMLQEEEDDVCNSIAKKTEEELLFELKEINAKTDKIILEMIGDIPEADIAPPENVLFVCKLNPVTEEEDLRLIFERFGPITECSIIRDWKTQDSLCYAFITYINSKDCENAYIQMNNVLIDERRIRVDFSQSVAKYWSYFKKGGKFTHANASLRVIEANMGSHQSRHSRGKSYVKLDFKKQSEDVTDAKIMEKLVTKKKGEETERRGEKDRESLRRGESQRRTDRDGRDRRDRRHRRRREYRHRSRSRSRSRSRERRRV